MKHQTLVAHHIEARFSRRRIAPLWLAGAAVLLFEQPRADAMPYDQN